MPRLAAYDWRGLSIVLREAVARDGRGLAPVAAEAGVTTTDLSRALSAINVGPAKCIALCRWAGVSVEHFYVAPATSGAQSSGCGAHHVKQEGR